MIGKILVLFWLSGAKGKLNIQRFQDSKTACVEMEKHKSSKELAWLILFDAPPKTQCAVLFDNESGSFSFGACKIDANIAEVQCDKTEPTYNLIPK